MKKLFVMFAVALLIAAFIGCGSAPQQSQSTVPDWVSEIAPEDVFWGIGIAKLQSDSLAMETATTRAQRDVARQISVLVQGMLTDYESQSGSTSNPRALEAIERIGRNLINTNLSGAVPNQRTKMPDGTWWVRVSIRKADAKRVIDPAIENEAADLVESRSPQALSEMDTQIDKHQSTPEPRSVD